MHEMQAEPRDERAKGCNNEKRNGRFERNLHGLRNKNVQDCWQGKIDSKIDL